MAIEVFDYPVAPSLRTTTLRGIETLLVGLVYEGRVLPVAFSCFMKWSIQKSQNILEHSLALAVMSCFSIERRALLILDRGYARVNLFIRHLIGQDPNSLGPSSTKRSPLVPRIHSNRLSLLSPSFALQSSSAPILPQSPHSPSVKTLLHPQLVLLPPAPPQNLIKSEGGQEQFFD
jgi:hypothetical protein